MRGGRQDAAARGAGLLPGLLVLVAAAAAAAPAAADDTLSGTFAARIYQLIPEALPLSPGEPVIGCFRYRASDATIVEEAPGHAEYRLAPGPANVVVFKVGELVLQSEAPLFVFVADQSTARMRPSEGIDPGFEHDRLEIHDLGADHDMRPVGQGARVAYGLTLSFVGMPRRVVRVVTGPEDVGPAGTTFLASTALPASRDQLDFIDLHMTQGRISLRWGEEGKQGTIAFYADPRFVTVEGEAVEPGFAPTPAILEQAAEARRLCAEPGAEPTPEPESRP